MTSATHINIAPLQCKCSGRSAFTLIELVVVIGLMLILMAAGTAGYRGMRRGAELRGAEAAVRTTLMLARQQAITRRQNVQLSFVQEGSTFTTNSMKIFAGGAQAHAEVFLPGAIEFEAPLPSPIEFKPAGSAGAISEVKFHIKEKEGMGEGDTLGRVQIIVWPLTGLVKIGED